MGQKILICTVGLPRSGKSTWAKSTGYPIVNPDSVRLSLHGQAYIQLAEPFVWAITECMVRSLFEAGHDLIILDATNTTQKRRSKWVSKDWRTVFKMFDVGRSVCEKRALDSGRDDLIPVIDRMSENFEQLNILEKAYVWEKDNIG